MVANSQKLRVGVSIYLKQGQQSIWENGAVQNCVFLAQLLNQSPLVKRAVLVNGGNAMRPRDGMLLKASGLGIVNLTEALQSLDVIIEMGVDLDAQWVAAFKAKGGKLVWMRVGNDYVIDMERAMFDKPHATLCNDKPYDAIWTIPEYERSCTDYFALTTRAPVRIVPHIWTPYFLDQAVKSLPKGWKYGYQPGSAKWKMCSLEPNLCMVKTAYFPMLVCEQAYRAKPDFLESMLVCSTLELKKHIMFEGFSRRLDIVNDGKATFEGRFLTYEFMAQYANAVIAHHWENGQNYLYYELLYGGYPLIHNSEFIKDCGYYYPEFDCIKGGEALLQAFLTHDSQVEQYAAQAAKLIKSLDIGAPDNVRAYTNEIGALYGAAR
jgi:Protein of unknown function (DUF2827)